jgi:hypothetical protein
MLNKRQKYDKNSENSFYGGDYGIEKFSIMPRFIGNVSCFIFDNAGTGHGS